MAYDIGTARGVIELDYNGRGVQQAKNDLNDLEDKGKKNFDKVGRAAAIGGAAVVGGLGVAVAAAASFEKRMSAVAAVSGATPAELEKLSDKALDLGKKTSFSASESAAAIEELAKAGIPIADIMNGAADATVALAEAGEVSLVEASTIASNAMNQFNIPAKGMVGVVDSIAGAANSSAIDVTDFGQSLAQVGAVANLTGTSFDDTATAIALMGNAGIKGSDAGTSLKTMLMRLNPTTEKAYNKMEELGLITMNAQNAMKTLKENGITPAGNTMKDLDPQLRKLAANLSDSEVNSAKAGKEYRRLGLQNGYLRNQFFDANGEVRSMSEISGKLQGALKGQTKEQKLATLNTLFGADAIRGAAVLSNEGAAGFDKMSKSMGKTSAAEVAKKRMDNLAGSMEELKGSLETAGITLGTVLIPVVRKLVDFFTTLLNKFLSLSSAQQKWILIGIAAIGMILLTIAAIFKYMKMTAALKLALAGTRLAFIATWAAALGPVLLIIAAIAAVIAIFVILYKKNEKFRAVVDAVWKKVKAVIGSVVDWIVNAMVPWLVGAFDKIVGAVRSTIRVVGRIWKVFWGMFGGIVKAYIKLVLAIIKLAWVLIKGFFLLGVKAVMWVVKATLGPIVKMVRGFMMGAWEAIKWVWDKIVQTYGDKVRSVMDKLIWLKDKVMGFFNGAKDWLSGAGGDIIQGLIDGISGMMGKVTDKITEITDKIGKFLPGSPVREGPLKKLNRGAAGKEIIEMLITGIDNMADPLASAMKTATSGMTLGPPVGAVAAVAGVRTPPPSRGPVHLTIPVYNPVAEPAGQSVTRVLKTKVDSEGWSV